MKSREMKMTPFRLPASQLDKLKDVVGQMKDQEGKPLSIQRFLESLVAPYLSNE